MQWELLETIPWSKLFHAYGTSEEVPNWLKNLVNPDTTIHQQALGHIYQNILHQGSRYPVSPYVMYLLYLILLSPSTPKQHLTNITELIFSIAVGNELDEASINGFDVDLMRQTIKKQHQYIDLSDAFHIYYKLDELECYEIGLKCVPTWQKLLVTTTDKTFKKMLAFILSWFPDEKANTCQVLKQVLQNTTDSSLIGTIIIALRTVQNGHVAEDERKLIFPYLYEESIIVRSAAAVYLMDNKLNCDVVYQLIDVLNFNAQRHYEYYNEELYDLDLAGLAAETLLLYDSRELDQLLPYSFKLIALSRCNRLKEIFNPITYNEQQLIEDIQRFRLALIIYPSSTITYFLLSIVGFKQRYPYPPKIPKNTLTLLQKEVLAIIAQYSSSHNLGMYGLPENSQDLWTYLED